MLISAIMPTRGRPGFALQALGSFLAQSWPDKELVIVDDANARSFEQPPEHPNVHYHLTEQRMKLGEKRNFAVEQTHGEIIAHFDDDDFSEPGRLEDQLVRLNSSACSITGYHTMRFWDEEAREWWSYSNDWHGFVLGTSLMYRRSFWEKHPFPPLNLGEDYIFAGKARRNNAVASASGTEFMWARKHVGNSVKKAMLGTLWKREAA